MKTYAVYIMASASGVLYIGITNDLQRRVIEHREKLLHGFSARYNIQKLVYFELFRDVRAAIAREKELKGWLRKKKIALIESVNPRWQDLSPMSHAAVAKRHERATTSHSERSEESLRKMACSSEVKRDSSSHKAGLRMTNIRRTGFRRAPGG